MSLADVQTLVRDGILVVSVTGEVDMSNAENVGSAVVAAIPADVRGVVLDLSRVEYLDSAGVFVIQGVRQTLLARDQAFALVAPAASPASATLRIAGVSRDAQTADTVDEALQTLDGHETPGA
jgi:anti-anti-sigma factor